MKKTIYAALLSAMALASCQREEIPAGSMRGEFYADIPGEKAVVELFPGGSQVFDVRAYARGAAVADVALNLSLKADPSLVESFNAEYGTDYVMCPGSSFEFTKGEVMMPRFGTASTTGKVKIVASGLDNTKTYILPIVLEDAKAGENFVVADTLAAYVLFKQNPLDISKGMGTADAPFMIYDVDDIKGMGAKCQETATVFFRLANDIDMSDISSWDPVTDVKFDLDGAGKTISNFTAGTALFGIVSGRIHDLNIENANITNSLTSPVGIVACRFGAAASPSVAERVYVQGKVTNTLANGTGGLFGVISDAKINACSASVELSSNKYDVGGICGYDSSASDITNCWTSGEINSPGRYIGGISGQIYSTGSTVMNCCTTMTIIGHFYFGGIAGSANLGAKADNAVNNPQNRIEKCIVWSKSIESDVTDEAEHYSAGAIIGYTALKNYHVDCYRRADLEFKECPGNAGNVLCDHGNSSPEQPLNVGLSGTYIFPYHGKAAAAGDTASSVAKKLGWDETLWDLSGNVPFFKGASAPVEDPDVPSEGQLPDFDDNEFYK